MKTAFSYVRFSNPNQATKSKLLQQREQAKKYAAENGLILDESLSFDDLGVSAYRSENIEFGKLGEFLSAIRAGYIERGSYLLIENLDRLSRNSVRKALRALEDICDEGITVVTLMDNQKYTAEKLDRDPVALLISLVIFLRANEESRTKSERATASYASKLELAAQGEKVILLGNLPGWLRRDGDKIVIDKEKAKIVEQIYELAELGKRPSQIAKILNSQKTPTLKKARFWRNGAVSIILKKPAAIGTYQHCSDRKKTAIRSGIQLKEIKNYYPRVISEKKWKRVQTIIRERKENLPPGTGIGYPKRRNIFSWLAKCPECGDAMSCWERGSATNEERPLGYYLEC